MSRRNRGLEAEQDSELHPEKDQCSASGLGKILPAANEELPCRVRTPA
jgi:hypothetical protein